MFPQTYCKKIIISALLALLIFPTVVKASAAGDRFNQGVNTAANEAGYISDNNNKDSNIPVDAVDYAGRVIEIFFSVMGILFLFLMIYGGLIWMNARGQEQELTKAKSIIRNSIIGLIIVFSAYIITNFIFGNI